MSAEYNILQIILASSQNFDACCGLFRTHCSRCVLAAPAAPGSICEMQNFGPNLDLVHQNLHFDEIPQMFCVHIKV